MKKALAPASVWNQADGEEYTRAAQIGSAVMNAVKDGQITAEEALELLAKNTEALNDKDTSKKNE